MKKPYLGRPSCVLLTENVLGEKLSFEQITMPDRTYPVMLSLKQPNNPAMLHDREGPLLLITRDQALFLLEEVEVKHSAEWRLSRNLGPSDLELVMSLLTTGGEVHLQTEAQTVASQTLASWNVAGTTEAYRRFNRCMARFDDQATQP
ncbi:hypothetical protein AADZ90_010510 [Aestuariibius sp. 2305UL40-4]|uniref:hypothetical protein n=1 Tax=Aestuariibius violaceus TaxID=3234132 RepID=UPI003497F647